MHGQRALKKELHRWFDPLLARHKDAQWRASFQDLANGEYTLSFDVPYVPQFASPEKIVDYIHHDFIGLQDARWREFGTDEPESYAFWAPRVCALACLKMAIAGYATLSIPPTLWELVQNGLALAGYKIYDEQGHWLDEGWYVQAQIELAHQYGLHLTGHSYASPLGICHYLYQDKLVAATVSPEIGERIPQSRRYGGHLVVVTGFRWEDGQPTALRINNPSGRYPELQADAWLPMAQFKQFYAYRFAVYEKLTG